MCHFVLLRCVACSSIRRPELLLKKDITETVRVFEEVSCNYWYCDALSDALKSNRQTNETCGDQFCEVDRCSAKVVMWNCCSNDRPVFYRRYRGDVAKGKLRIEPYLIPALTNRQLLKLLLEKFLDSDLQLLSTCYDDKLIVVDGDYKLYFSTYYVYVRGSTYDQSKVRYQVRVERGGVTAHPLIYDGLLSKFLALRVLHRRRRAGTSQATE